MAARRKLATVWLLTDQGRQLAGHSDADRAWKEKEASAPFSEPRSRWFSPVEIGIGLDDVCAAVAKWERVAEQHGVCHVEVRDPRPGERRNEFYDFTNSKGRR